MWLFFKMHERPINVIVISCKTENDTETSTAIANFLSLSFSSLFYYHFLVSIVTPSYRNSITYIPFSLFDKSNVT